VQNVEKWRETLKRAARSAAVFDGRERCHAKPCDFTTRFSDAILLCGFTARFFKQGFTDGFERLKALPRKLKVNGLGSVQ
jgi:hypothetical protein